MPSNDSPLFWNEFQWEEEIRRDERRICGYFHELPSCLDLPGEEEMIYEKLFSQVDLMPVNGKTGALRNWDDGEDEEEWEDNGPPHKLLIQLDCLALEWNVIIVNSLPEELSSVGLGIACQYGKLIVRTANFLEDAQMEKALRISLGKRCLTDLNDLAGSLAVMSQTMKELHLELRAQQEMLGHIREQLLNELKYIRRDADLSGN
jgi:hypothetical protein